MGLFKSKEEKQHERQEQERLVTEQSELEAQIQSLNRYPGSLSEYNSLMDAEHEIMDTGRGNKFVFVDNQNQSNVNEQRETLLLKRLIGEGCTGLIWYVPVAYTAYQCNNFGYGVPVRKK